MTNLAVETATAEEMLHAHTTNAIVLPEGALVIANEADRPTLGIGISMVALPRETLYILQDGVTAELQAREGRTLQVMNKKCINMEELSL